MYFLVGDLKDEDTLLKWLVAGKEGGNDEIEDINRNSFAKLLDNQKFVAVYFCESRASKSLFLTEKSSWNGMEFEFF